jgi:hypothetical protein
MELVVLFTNSYKELFHKKNYVKNIKLSNIWWCVFSPVCDPWLDELLYSGSLRFGVGKVKLRDVFSLLEATSFSVMLKRNVCRVVVIYQLKNYYLP